MYAQNRILSCKEFYTMRRVLTSIAVLLCCFTIAATPANAELKVGDKVPDFTLKGSDGKSYTLSKLSEKQVVVIAWFPKAFTGG